MDVRNDTAPQREPIRPRKETVRQRAARWDREDRERTTDVRYMKRVHKLY